MFSMWMRGVRQDPSTCATPAALPLSQDRELRGKLPDSQSLIAKGRISAPCGNSVQPSRNSGREFHSRDSTVAGATSSDGEVTATPPTAGFGNLCENTSRGADAGGSQGPTPPPSRPYERANRPRMCLEHPASCLLFGRGDIGGIARSWTGPRSTGTLLKWWPKPRWVVDSGHLTLANQPYG